MTDKYLKTNISGYYKDRETGSIINTNYDEYERYLSQRNQHRDYVKTKQDIESLKEEMAEMKKLLMEKIKNV